MDRDRMVVIVFLITLPLLIGSIALNVHFLITRTALKKENAELRKDFGAVAEEGEMAEELGLDFSYPNLRQNLMDRIEEMNELMKVTGYYREVVTKNIDSSEWPKYIESDLKEVIQDNDLSKKKEITCKRVIEELEGTLDAR
ncbi:MAG: hypothetical protein ACYS47_10705 [Planctomycetota bacterium]